MALSETGSRKTQWLLVLVLVMMAGLAATNIYLLFNQQNAAAPAEPVVENTVPEAGSPIFVRIDPFTVNLQGDAYSRNLLYTALWLQVEDTRTRDYLTTHMPQVRSQLLSLLSAQDVTLATAPDGKDILAAKIRDMLQTSLTTPPAVLSVSKVLFSEFIVQ